MLHSSVQLCAPRRSRSCCAGLLHMQVSEERLIGLLEQIATQQSSRTQTKVTIQRRRPAWDDD